MAVWAAWFSGRSPFNEFLLLLPARWLSEWKRGSSFWWRGIWVSKGNFLSFWQLELIISYCLLSCSVNVSSLWASSLHLVSSSIVHPCFGSRFVASSVAWFWVVILMNPSLLSCSLLPGREREREHAEWRDGLTILATIIVLSLSPVHFQLYDPKEKAELSPFRTEWVGHSTSCVTSSDDKHSSLFGIWTC